MNSNSMIMVLGYRLLDNGGHDKELEGRLNKGIEIFKKGLGKKVIFSGGMGNPKADKTEASVMKSLAILKGIDSKDIILEEKSLDTIGNAYFSKQIVKSYSWNKIYVVTSCCHMPRASFIFNMCYGSGYELNYDYCSSGSESYEKAESEKEKTKLVKSFFKGMKPGNDEELKWRMYNKHGLYKDKT